MLPAEAATLLEDSLSRSAASARDGILMTVFGFLLALWATTSAATTLMAGLTTTFDRRDSRGFVHKRLAALAIVACLLLAVGLVLGLLVLGPHVERWVGRASGAPTLTAWAWWTAQWPILVGGLLLAFAVVLAIGPDVEERRWRLVTPGALVALVIWLVASAGFALFTARFGTYEKTWGTLSAVVVTLIWLWLTAGALLFGAEVNAEVERAAARRRGTQLAAARDECYRTTDSAVSSGAIRRRSTSVMKAAPNGDASTRDRTCSQSTCSRSARAISSTARKSGVCSLRASTFVARTSSIDATLIVCAITSTSDARSNIASSTEPPDGRKIRSTSVAPSQAL